MFKLAFTGLRPCEEIAMTVADIDLKHKTVSINKSRVHGELKDCRNRSLVFSLAKAVSAGHRSRHARLARPDGSPDRHDHQDGS